MIRGSVPELLYVHGTCMYKSMYQVHNRIQHARTRALLVLRSLAPLGSNLVDRRGGRPNVYDEISCECFVVLRSLTIFF